MSRTWYCSAPGCTSEADVNVADLHTGDQTPLCAPHLYEWCRFLVDSADQVERDATDAEAEARIAAVPAPPQARADYGPDPIDDAGPVDTTVDPFPATAKVVRKHTSKSRRAYETRKAAKVAAADAVAIVEAGNAPEPSEAATGDFDDEP